MSQHGTVQRPRHDPGSTQWLGVNFWSRSGGPFMWRHFDADLVRRELQTMRDHGLATTRSFFFWPDFHPQPAVVDEAKCEAFAAFLDLHTELGMNTIPTFIVGHMSGQNWDPAWRQGRDLYTDTWMVGRQAWFIEQMTRRFAAHDAVAGWLISNEMPLYGGGGGLMGPVDGAIDVAAVQAWSLLMIQAVRAGGGRQPVSLGDGAWGLEVNGEDNGFRLTDVAPLVDWLGPHCYQMTDDPLRQALTPAFVVELANGFDRPVILEEFGVSDEFTSAVGAADYYRVVLHSTLAAGATGWLAWNNTDFDLSDQQPYDHRPFELHFGLTTAEGEPKPVLHELAQFRALLNELDLPNLRRVPTGTSVYVSSYLDTLRPFWDAHDEAPALRDAARQSYIAARLSGLTPAVVRESDGPAQSRLVVVPSAKAITSPGRDALLELARSGSTVFGSFSPGESGNQRGWWWPGADEFFGVERDVRYGLIDRIDGDEIVWTFECDFGDVKAGETLRFPVGGNDHLRSVLPARATHAAVVAVDQAGRPALLDHHVGAGHTVLSTYPVELFAARTPSADITGLARLYASLARVAGITPAVTLDRFDVLAEVFDHSDGQRQLLLQSLSPDKISVTVRSANGFTFAGSGAAHDLALPAYGAASLRLDPTTS